MGDTQSAERAGKKDAEEEKEEEESAKVNDVQTVQNTEDKPLKTNGQISEINGKADGSVAALNGHCKDEISAEDKDVARTEKSPKEEKTPVESVDINAKTSPDEADANEVEQVEIIEMEEKQNDINESFRHFFSNVGLKLTVNKGSGEKAETDVPEEVPNIPEEVKDNAQEVKSKNEEQNVDLDTAQDANEYDSTVCPSLTDGASENIPENAEMKKTETKEEAEHDNNDARTTSPAVNEDGHQDSTCREELHPGSPLITDEKVVESPLKRFFTKGIFSSLRKKKKLTEDEVTEKELVDMGKNETAEIAEQAVEEQNKQEITLDSEAATTEKGLGEAEILPATTTQDDVKPPSMDKSDGECEILNSQEKEKVQASPLKKLMSGSSFKSLSKKQKGKKSSDAKISDSQEQVSDQLMSSIESAENQKEESLAQPSEPAAEEEDSAWAAFKKLVTPKKRIKRPSLSNEQAQISGSVDEAKPSEGEQISDHSTEEGKKRKDSSVSWEAVLCGSGRRKSRKSSDSEEETPPNIKQDSGLKQGAESPLERSNEAQEIKEGSLPESDGESTWKSFKKLVTPKTKAKDMDESKDIIPSDNEVTQGEPTFSIKNLLPGRKKRKPAEKPEQVSSDEADKEASGDEDSETPAVIPLSEFDADEMGTHAETKADVESYVTEVTDNEVQQDSTPPCDSLPLETQTVQDNEEALENEVPKTLATPAPIEEPDDLSESISKHQQLSDIPEEGVLTETMVTPASGTEEAARDDTIAEDLVEITSEAVTAPEPVDVTVTDETEMISAVSQLSDSSKTSGNATPVPAEYSVKDTELLLEQVAETISVSTRVVPVTLEEPSSERIVSSVSPQLRETFEKEQPKILELHKGSDETVVNAELNAEPIDAINELEATAQTESIPDVNKAASIEIVNLLTYNLRYNAEVTEDKVHEVSVTQVQESIKELEVQHVPECITEEKKELPQETLPEGDEVAPDKGSLIVANPVEEDTSKTETEEPELALFVADETKDGSMEQEAQTSCSMGDQINQNITEQIQIEDEPSVVVDELEALANVEKDVKASEEDTVQSLEKEAPSLEDIPPPEILTNDSKQTDHLVEVTVEPEDRQTQAEAPKTDDHEVKDVVEAEQKVTVDAEEDRVQSPEEEALSSEDVPPAESIDEFKQIGEHEDEVSNEPENKEPQPQVSEVPEVPKDVQSTTLESEEDSIQEEIQPSQDVQSAEPVTDESKQKSEYLIEVTEEPETKEPQPQVSEVPEVPEDVQATILESEEDSIQEEIQSSQDIQSAEPVTDESKQTSEYLIQVTEEPETKESQPEVSEVPEVLENVQAITLESEKDSIQKEVQPSQDIQAAEPVTDESKQTSEYLIEVTEEPETKESQPDVSEVPEVPEDVQATILESEEDSIQEEIQPSQDVQSAEPVTDESKQTSEYLIEVTEEPETKEPQPQVSEVPEVPEDVQATILESEEDSIQEEIQSSQDIQSAEPVTDESKQTSEYLIEVTEAPETKEPQPEVSEVPEVPEDVQATILESEEDSIQEEIQSSQDIQSAEPVTDESKQTSEYLIQVTEEPETKESQPDVSEVPEVPEDVQATILESEEDSIQEEIQLSQDVQSAEPVTDESKQTSEYLIEVTEEPETKEPQPEVSEVPEVPEDVQATILESEENSIQEEIQSSQDIQSAEPVTDESKQTSEYLIEVTEAPETKEPQPEVSEVPEVPEDVQATILESEEDSIQEEIQSSQDIQAAEPVTDESKQTSEYLIEVTEEPETKESQPEVSEVPEVPEDVQATILESEEDSIQEEIQSSQDIQAAEPVTDESKQTSEYLIEVTKEPETKESQPEVSEVPEVPEDVQATILESEEDSIQEEIQSSQDIQSAEPVTDESKQTSKYLIEVTEAPETKEPQPEVSEVPEVPEDVQATTLESEEDSIQEEIQPSQDIQAAEPVTDQSKHTGEHLTEGEVSDEPETKEPQPQVSEVTEVSEGVQATTLESEEDSVQTEIQPSEGIQSPEPVTDKSKELGENVIEVSDEIKTKEPQPKVSKVTEEPEVFQATSVDSEEDSVQTVKQPSQDIRSTEPITEEYKQTTEHPTEVTDEIQKKEPQPEVPEKIEAVQAATLDLEKGSGQLLDKEVISGDVPPAEKDQPKEAKMVPITEDKVEALHESITKDVQKPAVLQVVQAVTLDSEPSQPQGTEDEVISKEMAAMETVTGEPKQKAVDLMEPEASLPDAEDSVPETDREASGVEVFSLQELETETLLEDVPKPDTDGVTDEIETKQPDQPDQDLEIHKDQKTESIPQNDQAKHEDRKAEAVEETVLALYVPCVEEEEASNDQVHEETCVDSAEASEEPKYHKDVSTAQVSVEGEKAGELQGTEVITAAPEHAVVMQVITCNLKDVTAVIPDVSIEETEIQEHLIERKASEMEVKDTVETTMPLKKDNVINTAEEGSVVVMMHVPSLEFDNNHRFQVQVVDVDFKSAENIVDTMIEVGVTEAKEVIDVCHETLEKIENLSASTAVEEEVNNEENNLTVQKVIQHVKENLPETIPESVPHKLEEKVISQPDVSETVQSVSSKPEDQKMMKDSSGGLMEEENEGHGIPAEQKESEDQLQTSDLGLDISTHDHKEDLKETKAELQKSEVCMTAEDATTLSEEFAKKKDGVNTTEAQKLQSTQSQIVTPNNTGLVASQNAGMISSIGNVESPSSLSLEFKLNIQFGQLKEPASPPPPAEPVKQLNVSKVAVQGVEAVKPTNLINAMQRVESEKQMERMEVAVQAVEAVKPNNLINAMQRVESEKQMERMEVAVQAVEAVEPTNLIDAMQRVESEKQIKVMEVAVQAVEAVKPTNLKNAVQRVESEKQMELMEVAVQAVEAVKPTNLINAVQRVESEKQMERMEVAVQAVEAVEPTNLINAMQRVESEKQMELMEVAVQALEAVEPTNLKNAMQRVESEKQIKVMEVAVQAVEAVKPTNLKNATQRVESEKQIELMEVAVQAVEAVKPTNLINAMQRVESEKQMELMEVAVQTTEITESEAVVSHQPKLQDVAVQEMEKKQSAEQVQSKEPIISKIQAAEITKPVKQITKPAEKLDLPERAMISKQPVLQAVSIQTIETTEPVEQIQSKQSIIPDIQAAQMTEPVMQKEKRGMLISHPAVFKARSKEKTAQEPIKQIEEENDDVWLDAEEDIYTQEEKGASHFEVEEPTEPQAESEQEEKEDPESEFEMAPDTKSEDEESHQRVHKTGGGAGETESEGEDFAVALEYPVITTCVTHAEWD